MLKEALAQELFDLVSVGVIVWELDGTDSLRLAYGNGTAARLMGKDWAALLGMSVQRIFPTADASRLSRYATLAEVCRTRVRHDFGVLCFAEGSVPSERFAVTAVPVGERSVAIVFESVSALRAAELEAQRLNRFLDSIIEHVPAMIFMKDAELRFERLNRAGEELLGRPRNELLGKSDYDFFPKEQADFFVAKDREVLRRGTVEDIPEEPIETAQGTRWLHTRKIPLLDENGRAQHLLGISIDITEHKQIKDRLSASHEALEQRVSERSAQLEHQIAERSRAERALANTEEQLRQAQKMEAIGRLAGGVAHDFNNILSVILSYTSLALSSVGSVHPLHADLSEIRRAAERASDLTRQLLAFSRQQLLAPRIVDLNRIVMGLQQMLARLIGEDVELQVELAPGLHDVKVDASQIEQVLLNLAVNARDAMPYGGKLRIETSNVLLEAAHVRELLDVSVGSYVLLSVNDSGTGMDRETQARIFEPFFTTKDQGRGTGLGLSTVFGIVKQSGGSILVESEVGSGTTFKLYLPSLGRRTNSSEPRMPAIVAHRGGESVLLVEDEEQVRRVVLGALQRAGYQVLEAKNPLEALAIGEDLQTKIDLLLTDVVMPQLSGPELAKRLLARRPGLRVLCMSGYTDDAVLRHGILRSEMAFLQKPLTPDTLLGKVREVLDATGEVDGSSDDPR
ncbi:MAG TPA: PAS domain-containing protein [Polyangiaceae bacterium]|nr:PAS domain-containing protein [Polyangiaceae bacterium]